MIYAERKFSATKSNLSARNILLLAAAMLLHGCGSFGKRNPRRSSPSSHAREARPH